MPRTRRRLKDAVSDSRPPRSPKRRKAAAKRARKRNLAALKLGIAVILGFAGGFSTARWLMRL